jgi:transcriptional regulator with XRE-family HTH domain
VIDPKAILKGRVRRRWSQAGLGALCDRSKQAVQKVETGELTVIRPEFAAALAHELDLDFDRVFAPVSANRSRTVAR